jgi:hypothetical protein
VLLPASLSLGLLFVWDVGMSRRGLCDLAFWLRLSEGGVWNATPAATFTALCLPETLQQCPTNTAPQPQLRRSSPRDAARCAPSGHPQQQGRGVACPLKGLAAL